MEVKMMVEKSSDKNEPEYRLIVIACSLDNMLIKSMHKSFGKLLSQMGLANKSEKEHGINNS